MSEHTLRFAVSLGGFLIFIGIIMVGVFTIVFLSSENVASALDTPNYRTLALWILLAVGVLDLVSGLMLRRRWLR